MTLNQPYFSLYILKCNDGSFYTGITKDLEERMRSHQTGDEKCAKHTKNKRPVKLVFSVNGIKGGRLARNGEKYIKKLTREKKVRIINRDEKAIQLLNKRIFPE